VLDKVQIRNLVLILKSKECLNQVDGKNQAHTISDNQKVSFFLKGETVGESPTAIFIN
jgi:hypothetical protein